MRLGSRARRARWQARRSQGAGISSDGSTLLIDTDSFEEPPSHGRIATVPLAGGRPTLLVAHGAQASWNG